MNWTYRPADDQPAKVVPVFMFAILTFAFGLIVLHQGLLGFVGSILLLGGTADFWLSTEYRLSENVASAKCGLSFSEIEWFRVNRVIVNGRSIRLSPLKNGTRMEEFRGVLLRTLPSNHEEVLQMIQKRCQANVRILGSRVDD